MNKKYYWLKLQHDFFKQPRIKKLRKIAGGDTYTIIYLELQLLSLSNNGVLVFEGIEDDFIEELALTLDEDVDNVRLTVSYLMKHGLIEEIKEDEFALIETMKNIGSESASAKRVREHRQKVKSLQCNTDVTNCNIEKEIEKEKELEIDKEIDIEEILVQEFETLWKLYPNKKGKPNALKSYKKARTRKKNPVDYDTVANGIHNYLFYIKEANVSTQYIKHGSTWFNQECWNDDYTVTKTTDKNEGSLGQMKRIYQNAIENGEELF